ncbi:MAG: 16S rRNA (cytidine(1402)-2'-O)-methyltransferase [Deltaproteobacteria bacterium]|nr:16S rRNA (cytidine(1402)-2'-O)-methyltransferase [Deltaproteobacteria bacterium]
MPLFIVGTPIGNLKDISQRAIETLTTSEIILCESKERAKIIFESLGIKNKKVITFREDNKIRLTPEIIDYLNSNYHISLISDAGMPSISDPGSYLINEVISKNLPITVIPGPTAFSAALSLCGFNAKEYVFIGFLPRNKKEVENIINFYRTREVLLIFYESPYRILNSLKIIDEMDPSSSIFIAREMTKKHEEFIRGSPSLLIEILNKKEIKGEITVVVKFSPKTIKTLYDYELLKILKREKLKTKTIAKILASYYKVPIRSIYNEIIKDNN